MLMLNESKVEVAKTKKTQQKVFTANVGNKYGEIVYSTDFYSFDEAFNFFKTLKVGEVKYSQIVGKVVNI